MTAGRIAVVVGTRPEIIKVAEITKILGDRALVIHTGQHWDHAMSGSFMESLGVPEPDVSLGTGGNPRGVQIGRTVEALDGVLDRLRPAAVIVQGDTNTALGAALAANAREVPLVHVEAGLRSFDRRMPEEHNRVLIDHLADLCLAPTGLNREQLLAEGVDGSRIVVTGNTVVAAVSRAIDAGADGAAEMIDRLGLRAGQYVVATIHRPENTDIPQRLAAVVRALASLAADVPVLLPLHPRTRARLEESGLSSSLASVTVAEPLGYEEFVGLCARAALTISDSGGVQEEASVWKRPVIVVRRSTERPEVQGTFAHLAEPGEPMLALARQLYADRARLASELAEQPSPYGDLESAQRCVDAVERLVDHPRPDQSISVR